MPTYEYRCEKCGEQFEVFQSFSDRALRRHPDCGGPLEKVLHPRGIVFKGSGFYVTDSRAKSSSSTDSGGSNGSSEKSTEKSSSSSESGGKSDSSEKTGSGTKSETSSKSDKPRSGGKSGSDKPSGDRPSTSSAGRD